MKKLAVFLVVLTMLLSLTAFAEESNMSSVQEETPVENMLRNSVSATPRGAILLIGGNASALWQDCSFELYPHTVAALTVQDTLSADWTPCVPYLAGYAPTAIIFCLDGNDDPDEASVFAETLATSRRNSLIYFVSAFTGENTAVVNQSVSETCRVYSNAVFVDVYIQMLDENGVLDPSYVGTGLTPAGLRFMGEAVSKAVNADMPVIAPSVSVPEEVSDGEEIQTGKRSYRWLVPIVILAAGLIIGIDCARTAGENDKRRKARKNDRSA